MTNLAEHGPHNWQDFSDYWREADAEWLQARSVLRADTIALLPTTVPSPGYGQLAYVKNSATNQKDTLYLYSYDTAQDGTNVPGWKPYVAFPKHLRAWPDNPSQVLLSHHTGDSETSILSFSPAGLSVVSDLTVRNDVFKVTAADVSITTPGTGNKTVAFTTDTTGLVSDFPITAPGFVSTGGAVTMSGAVSVGDLTASGVVTSTGALKAKATLTVDGAASALQYTAIGTTTAGGYKAGGGQFYGDTNGAIIQRIAGGPQVLVNTAVEIKGGTNTDVDNQLRVLTGRPIEFRNTANNATLGYIGPVIVQASEPACPNGTIWVQT